jgi:hypothetical protein
LEPEPDSTGVGVPESVVIGWFAEEAVESIERIDLFSGSLVLLSERGRLSAEGEVASNPALA